MIEIYLNLVYNKIHKVLYMRNKVRKGRGTMLSKKIVWKLNIIDILLLAIIVLSVCALIYKATWGGDDESRTYEVSYVCENIPIELLGSLQSDMECSDYDSGSDLGRLKYVTSQPITEQAAFDGNIKTQNDDLDEDDADSESLTVPKTKEPTRARAMLVTEVDGAKAEHGVKAGGIVLLKALKLDLIVGDTVLNVYVSEIK